MILRCFGLTSAAILLMPMLPLAEGVDNYHGGWQPGYWYVAACLAAFAAGYAIRKNGTAGGEKRQQLAWERGALAGHAVELPRVKTAYLIAVAALALFGAAMVVLQVEMTLGFRAYLNLLEKGGHAAEVARSSTIMLDAGEGGLQGYLKVWNQNCTAAVLILIYLVASGRRFRGPAQWAAVALICSCFVVRNFLHMDRLALLAIVPATIQLWQAGSRRARLTLAMAAAAIVTLAEVQSIRRGHGFGAPTFFVLYVQSGMINLNLMMASLRVGEHTWGLAGILSPVYWVAKSAGVRLVEGADAFTWMWDAAQNAYGLLFEDFGWWGTALMILFGAMAQKWDSALPIGRQASKWKAAANVRLRALVAYAVLSMMFVPAYSGPEFWLTLGLLVGATWLETRHPGWCFAREAHRRDTPFRRYAANPAVRTAPAAGI